MSGPEVAKRIGVEYRTFHQWVDWGYIKPAHPAKGAGRPAHFTAADFDRAKLLADLVHAGMRPSAAAALSLPRQRAVLSALRGHRGS